jgi:hypothetical protein
VSYLNFKSEYDRFPKTTIKNHKAFRGYDEIYHELNSKITYKDINIDISTLTMNQNFGGYYFNIPLTNYLKADKLIYSIFIIEWEHIPTYTSVFLDTSATKITIYQATNSKQGRLKIRIVYKN